MTTRRRSRFRMAPAASCRRERPCATSRPAISPRLAKAALAARVDDRLVDLSFPLDHDARVRILTPPTAPEALHALPPLDGAPAGRRRHHPVPRRAVRHRPRDRRRLLLRLRRRAAVRARGPRAHRSARCASWRRRTFPTSGSCGRATRPWRFFAAARRAAQGPADRGEDRGPGRRLLLHDQGPRHVRRLLRRAARAVHRPAEGVQAAGDVERLLEGRRAQPADAARLRHGVLRGGGAEGAPHADRGGEEARPPQAGPRARPVHFHPWAPGAPFWLAQGHDALQPAGRLHARGALPRRLRRGEDAARLQQGAVGDLGALAALPPEHVPRRVPRASRWASRP